MHAKIHIDHDQNTVHEEYHGTIRLKDLIDVVDYEVEHPGIAPGMKGLVDFSDATTKLSHNDVRQVVAYMGVHIDTFRDFKMAIVTPRDNDHGLSRMYQMVSSDMPVKTMVFDDRDAAMTWLGLSDNSET